MSVVNLAILEPQHQAKLTGVTKVRLRGNVLSTGHRPLFFKWYSSLNIPSDPNNPALKDLTNNPPQNPLDFETSLKVGSHVLTFTAKDVPSDSLNNLKTAQDAGMAGGPPPAAKTPCLIHLFLASMIAPNPIAPTPTLSKASSLLEAEAPVQWGRKKEGINIYEPNPDYHQINQIRYRWRFTPLGTPAGRPSADLVPTGEQLTFDPTGAVPLVRYQGALPGVLAIGNYTLTLRVEDIKDSSVGHEISRNVVITA